MAPIGVACRGLDGFTVVDIELNSVQVVVQSATVTSRRDRHSDSLSNIFFDILFANAVPFCLWSKPPYMSGTVWDGLLYSQEDSSSKFVLALTLLKMGPLSCRLQRLVELSSCVSS